VIARAHRNVLPRPGTDSDSRQTLVPEMARDLPPNSSLPRLLRPRKNLIMSYQKESKAETSRPECPSPRLLPAVRQRTAVSRPHIPSNFSFWTRHLPPWFYSWHLPELPAHSRRPPRSRHLTRQPQCHHVMLGGGKEPRSTCGSSQDSEALGEICLCCPATRSQVGNTEVHESRLEDPLGA